MEKGKVTFSIETKQWEAFVASTLALIETSDRPLKVRRAFGKRVLNLFDKGRAIDFDQTTALDAGKMVIGFKPSQRLLGLVAAFRAGD